MDSTRRSTGTAQGQAIALCRRSIEHRREALENLRRFALQLEVASILETRAEQSNPTLASLLRERADERRRIAELIRTHLDGSPRIRRTGRRSIGSLHDRPTQLDPAGPAAVRR